MFSQASEEKLAMQMESPFQNAFGSESEEYFYSSSSENEEFSEKQVFPLDSMPFKQQHSTTKVQLVRTSTTNYLDTFNEKLQQFISYLSVQHKTCFISVLQFKSNVNYPILQGVPLAKEPKDLESLLAYLAELLNIMLKPLEVHLLEDIDLIEESIKPCDKSLFFNVDVRRIDCCKHLGNILEFVLCTLTTYFSMEHCKVQKKKIVLLFDHSLCNLAQNHLESVDQSKISDHMNFYASLFGIMDLLAKYYCMPCEVIPSLLVFDRWFNEPNQNQAIVPRANGIPEFVAAKTYLGFFLPKLMKYAEEKSWDLSVEELDKLPLSQPRRLKRAYRYDVECIVNTTKFTSYEDCISKCQFLQYNLKKNNVFQWHRCGPEITYNLKHSLPNSMYMKRIHKELKRLESDLPRSKHASIVVCADENHPQIMKAMVTGPEGTPYDSGLFTFHIYCPPAYPACPPEVRFVTTGNGKVRFNPNLYNCGKVCLSLLGTWSGNNKREEWSEDSSIWQVLVSIQSAILGVEYPVVNEPGFENILSRPDGDIIKRVSENGGYERLRIATLMYAMRSTIKKSDKNFRVFIYNHFYYKRDHILDVILTWLSESTKKSSSWFHYSGLKKAVLKFLKQLLRICYYINNFVDCLIYGRIIYLRRFCDRYDEIRLLLSEQRVKLAQRSLVSASNMKNISSLKKQKLGISSDFEIFQMKLFSVFNGFI